MINILELRNRIIEQYRLYVESFLDISDTRIRDFAQSILEKGALWPEPLLQCNPGFKPGDSVASLIKDEVLHPMMEDIFSGFHLHKHQSDAIRLGAQKKSFIVTSGTGSGKSLTYLGTIFQGILAQPQNQRNGVKAIIVYPMNALINSQTEEIKKYQQKFESTRAEKAFPITFAQYTGQEEGRAKQKIISNPPNILLTNYMMLELLLTRSKESDLRTSIFQSLEFLVFDELHTYRGRQGADVALLIRRMRSLAKNDLVMMGTSATLSSGTVSAQKNEVQQLARQLFDINLEDKQIIQESLEPIIKGAAPDPKTMAEVLSNPIVETASWDELINNPMSCWMEREIALEDKGGHLVRRTPKTVEEISTELAQFTQLDLPTCRKRLEEYLRLLQQVNQRRKTGFLPFRVHQFIAQTGTIRVTLEPPELREIKISDDPYLYKQGENLPFFPVVFNQQSGSPYICVKKTMERVEPRNPQSSTRSTKEEKEGIEYGYLLLPLSDQGELWSDARAQELLPDSWFDKPKNGSREIKSDKKPFLPKKLAIDPLGQIKHTPDAVSMDVWFMPLPLRIDPFSGTLYRGQQEFNKLTQLGNAGRSISTTILTYHTLQQLKLQKAPNGLRKFMSFTDNRQDAALQTGHFNDFMQQCFLRASIYQALKKRKKLDYSNIALAVFDVMNLDQKEYAAKQQTTRYRIEENEQALKTWLLHRIFFDLRRGWRHRMPNLEQCGLLEIRYKNLHKECDDKDHWESSDLLKNLEPDIRYEFLHQLLNFFRTSFALQDKRLEKGPLDEAQTVINDKLKSDWLYKEDQKLETPCWMCMDRLDSIHFRTSSIGYSSALGQYVKLFAKKQNPNLKVESKDYKTQLEQILQILQQLKHEEKTDSKSKRLGYLTHRKVGDKDLYRLNVDALEWALGEGKRVVVDKVRTRSMEEQQGKPNLYFQQLYSQHPSGLKKLEAREHTGQVPNKDRKEIEASFRKAEVKALYCSPTMELGIDIDDLSVVHMRNVPPNPANYAQRSGRAGRKGQGALIFTFCSHFSAHDRQFFQRQTAMVSGQVTAQKLDLLNEELLRSQLQALYLSRCGIQELNKSINQVVDLEKTTLPIFPSIQKKLALDPAQKEQVNAQFLSIIHSLMEGLKTKNWFTPTWVEDRIQEVPQQFDRALNRWRLMFKEAEHAKRQASIILKAHTNSQDSQEWKGAQQSMNQAQRKLDLLRNEAGKQEISEFYPFRYLASEGFLPGYNFTRLPTRIFLKGAGKDNPGTYVSRPRMLALSEFGPENIIYHRGLKRKVQKMILPASEGSLIVQGSKVMNTTGYLIQGEDGKLDRDPFSNEDLSNVENYESLGNLVELLDMEGEIMERISCQEDERVKKGYDIQTVFSYPGDWSKTKKLRLDSDDVHLLNIHYLPAADLVKINSKWKTAKEDGFNLHTQNGIWMSAKQAETKPAQKGQKQKRVLDLPQKPIKKIRLFTKTTADCLYLEPLSNLGLKEAGTITLMYALKKAVENHFQLEPQEIGSVILGKKNQHNILFFEAAEGSLGILSQLVEDGNAFRNMVAEAMRICYFQGKLDLHKNGKDHKASYDDLLSYYNQTDHLQIDRHLIQKALQQMAEASIRVATDNGFSSYESQYAILYQQLPSDCKTGRDFLEYLYNNKLKLPDKAWFKISNCSETVDFYYDPATVVLLDRGDQNSNTRTNALMQALDLQAIRVLSWNKGENLIEFVHTNRDLFASQQF